MYEYTAPRVYEALENAPAVQNLKAQIDANEEWTCVFERKGLRVTELGKQFVAVCVQSKA
ncbi:Abi-alpha family protein [Ideonella paludis]